MAASKSPIYPSLLEDLLSCWRRVLSTVAGGVRAASSFLYSRRTHELVLHVSEVLIQHFFSHAWRVGFAVASSTRALARHKRSLFIVEHLSARRVADRTCLRLHRAGPVAAWPDVHRELDVAGEVSIHLLPVYYRHSLACPIHFRYAVQEISVYSPCSGLLSRDTHDIDACDIYDLLLQRLIGVDLAPRELAKLQLICLTGLAI